MSKIKIKKFPSNLNGYNFVFAQYEISPKFGEMKLNKKEFHRSKQPIYLNQIEISKIVISDEFKLDDGNFQFLFTGCLSIQFFDPPPFFNTGSQATFGYVPVAVQHQCYLQHTISFQWSLDASHPTLLGKQRISLAVAVILSMCLSSHTQFDRNQLLII